MYSSLCCWRSYCFEQVIYLLNYDINPCNSFWVMGIFIFVIVQYVWKSLRGLYRKAWGRWFVLLLPQVRSSGLNSKKRKLRLKSWLLFFFFLFFRLRKYCFPYIWRNNTHYQSVILNKKRIFALFDWRNGRTEHRKRFLLYPKERNRQFHNRRIETIWRSYCLYMYMGV